MIHSDDQAHCLERARMHDRLAATTNDEAARQMHQAMAAEFRRRAGQQGNDVMSQPDDSRGPILKMSSVIG